jgi:hypothetical protein
MVLVVASLLLTLIQPAAAGVTGKWDGTVTAQREDGSTSEDTTLFILEQKDTTVTGTVGGNESDQFPLSSGTIEGNKLTFVAKRQDGREFKAELTLEKDELKGTVLSGERRATVHARRRKE